MNVRFETCERRRALYFLQQLYPSSEITDNKDSAKAILDLVEKDIVRIPDPKMHGCRVAIYPSTNWDDLNKDQYMKVLKNFQEKYK